jgi:hypothetical protein
MSTRLALIGLALVAVGCGRNQPPANEGGGRTPASAAGSRCASADDCALSSYRSATECCGDPCNRAEPYSKSELATLEAALKVKCKPGTFTCPVADCDRPRNVYPGCRDGKCIAVELPRPTECKVDADCELSCYEPGECCSSCDCETPWHKDDLARAGAWRSENCARADCPDKKCVAPKKVAHCENRRCVAK